MRVVGPLTRPASSVKMGAKQLQIAHRYGIENQAVVLLVVANAVEVPPTLRRRRRPVSDSTIIGKRWLPLAHRSFISGKILPWRPFRRGQ